MLTVFARRDVFRMAVMPNGALIAPQTLTTESLPRRSGSRASEPLRISRMSFGINPTAIAHPPRHAALQRLSHAHTEAGRLLVGLWLRSGLRHLLQHQGDERRLPPA